MVLTDITEILKNKGYKITPQRRAIIKALMDLEKMPTAKEIYTEVKLGFPDISLDTVYRNLYILVDTGVVAQLNLRFKDSSRFEISTESHHHHLVCLKCGEAVCLETCPFEHDSIVEDKLNNYQVVGHAFEIYGYCPKCQKVG